MLRDPKTGRFKKKPVQTALDIFFATMDAIVEKQKFDHIDYPMPPWAIYQLTRSSGLVEDVCKHRVGHPNIHSLKDMEKRGRKGFSIHGCDGCCCGKRRGKK